MIAWPSQAAAPGARCQSTRRPSVALPGMAPKSVAKTVAKPVAKAVAKAKSKAKAKAAACSRRPDDGDGDGDDGTDSSIDSDIHDDGDGGEAARMRLYRSGVFRAGIEIIMDLTRTVQTRAAQAAVTARRYGARRVVNLPSHPAGYADFIMVQATVHDLSTAVESLRLLLSLA